MDTGNQNLKKQLAVAVRSIQWSYSIFWSISPSDSGVLQWGEGCYNGDIKTRKTIEGAESGDVDQMNLKRSEQLRELYESLLVGESRRPSAALVPEDLSHTEWYYLVCMSFVFDLGQGLPGGALENGKPIWLCNAHHVDSRVFGRSLLAKSASIQTVVCFPFLGGVVELGTSDLVSEDHSLIQCVEASLLGTNCPAFSQIPISVIPNHFDTILDNALTPIAQGEEFRLLESPLDNGFGILQPLDETEFMTEGVDDELSNCVYTCMTSNDYISQNLGNPEHEGKIQPQEQENTEGSCLVKLESDIHGQSIDDLHYQNVLGNIFKTGPGLIWEPSVSHSIKESRFVSWKKGGLCSYRNPRYGNSQRMLKKILFGVPRMHGTSSSEYKVDGERKDKLCRPETDEIASSHVLAERKRRERVNEGFCALKSLIPSIDKVDKVSILDDTIKYMKELERRIEELESCQDVDERCVGKKGSKPQDAAERTSDNYRNSRVGVKRKAGDVDSEGKMENSLVSLRDTSTNTNLSISLIQKDVLIEITCPWKESLLLEIIDALTNLRLDTHSVQSSISDSFLAVTIKAKIKGLGGLSAGMIRQVLQRVLIKTE